jgi:hypothetical protein
VEDGFVNGALAVSADGSEKNLKGAQAFMLQRMDLLCQPWIHRPAKMQAKAFRLGWAPGRPAFGLLGHRRIVAFRYLNQFQQQRLSAGVDFELGVQLLTKKFAIEIV